MSQKLQIYRGSLRVSSSWNERSSNSKKVLQKVFEIGDGRNENSMSKRTFEKLVRSCDLFPYDQPVSEVKSFRSGVLSLITIMVCISITILELQALQNGEPQISIDKDAAHTSFAKVPVDIPQLFVTPGSASLLAKYPYFQNLSYYDVVAYERFIFESDTNDQKPRKKVKIPVTTCDISLSQYKSKSFKSGWCIGKDRQYSTVGEYSSPIYKYIGIDVIPCYAYNDSISITCAEKSEIMNLFYGKNTYPTFALYSKEPESYKVEKNRWTSKVYTSLPENQWLGLEVYFQPTRLLQLDSWFEGIKNNRTFSLFQYFETRTSNLRNNLFLRYYVRTAPDSVIRSEQVYSVRQVVARLGGYFILIYSVAQAIGHSYNKARYKVFEFIQSETNESPKSVQSQQEPGLQKLGTSTNWFKNPLHPDSAAEENETSGK